VIKKHGVAEASCQDQNNNNKHYRRMGRPVAWVQRSKQRVCTAAKRRLCNKYIYATTEQCRVKCRTGQERSGSRWVPAKPRS